jgi:hypothetical protein
MKRETEEENRSSFYTYFTSEDITVDGIGATTGVNAVASTTHCKKTHFEKYFNEANCAIRIY